MIKHADVDKCERILQPARDELVGLAGLCDSTGVLCANMTAAALCERACFTTSRGCTLAPSIVPRNSSSKEIRRCRLSSNGELTITGFGAVINVQCRDRTAVHGGFSAI